jgi:hypothetical protein
MRRRRELANLNDVGAASLKGTSASGSSFTHLWC